MHTHYDNLKVARNAPLSVVRAAYRVLSQQYHPDRNDSPDATRIMQILNDAWAVLSDETKRAEYDRELAAKVAKDHASGTTRTPSHEPPNPAREEHGEGTRRRQAEEATRQRREAEKAAAEEAARQRRDADGQWAALLLLALPLALPAVLALLLSVLGHMVLLLGPH